MNDYIFFFSVLTVAGFGTWYFLKWLRKEASKINQKKIRDPLRRLQHHME
jgi:hypothetical protein